MEQDVQVVVLVLLMQIPDVNREGSDVTAAELSPVTPVTPPSIAYRATSQRTISQKPVGHRG